MSNRNEDIVVYFNAKEVQITADIILNMCECPEDYFLFISAESALKEEYLGALAKIFGIKDSFSGTDSRIHTIVVGMQRWFRALPQITKNLKRKNEYWKEEILGNAYPTFKELMQSVEANSYEALFVTLPEIFECKDDYVRLASNIEKMKTLLSGYYKWMYAFCPECGCRLLRVQSGICELECAKCKKTIVVKFEDGLLEIFKSRREKERVQ